MINFALTSWVLCECRPVPDMGWWWRWVTFVNPVYYTMYAVSANELHDNHNVIVRLHGGTTTVSEYIEEFYGFITSGVFPGMVRRVWAGHGKRTMGQTSCP